MKKLFFSFIAITSILVACQHHPDEIIVDNTGNGGGGGGGNPDPVNLDPCDPDTVYFQNDILPLLVSSCAQPDCHDAITHEDGVRLYDYSHIMQQVVPGNLNASDLVDAIYETGGDMMPPANSGGPLSQEQKDMIETWILQGALNNSCTPDCDPTAFTYATTIQPMIDNYCTGCHSGTNPDGGLALVTYADISGSALDGSLMSSLTATNGYTLMPYLSNALVQCKIDQVQAWIDAGAPNN